MATMQLTERRDFRYEHALEQRSYNDEDGVSCHGNRFDDDDDNDEDGDDDDGRLGNDATDDAFSDSEETFHTVPPRTASHAAGPVRRTSADDSPLGKMRRVGSTQTPRRVLSPSRARAPAAPAVGGGSGGVGDDVSGDELDDDDDGVVVVAAPQRPRSIAAPMTSFSIKTRLRSDSFDSPARNATGRPLRTKSHESSASVVDEAPNHLSDLASSRYCYVASDDETQNDDAEHPLGGDGADDHEMINAELNGSFTLSTVKSRKVAPPPQHRRSNSASQADNDDVDAEAADWLARHASSTVHAAAAAASGVVSPRDVDDSSEGAVHGGRSLFGPADDGVPRTAYKKRARAPREPTTADITFPVSLVQHTNIFTPDTRGRAKPGSAMQLGAEQAAAAAERRKAIIDSPGRPTSAPARAARMRIAPSTLYGALFVEEALLGEGSFGRVYRCRHRLDGALYAVKVSKQPLRRAKQFAGGGGRVEKAALREAWALAALPSSKHVLRYYAAWYEQGHLYIQTELCDGGTLEQHKHLNAIWSEEALCNILRQVTKGLHVLHLRHFVHLDIKPENIYVSLDEQLDAAAAVAASAEPNPATCTFKLGDLGLMCRADEHIDHEGDSRYLARDLLQDDQPDLIKCDIFSLGISIYELASGRPLPKDGDAWRELREGHVPSLPYGYSTQFRRMLARMMHPIAFSRPSTDDLLREPLLLSSTEKELLHLKELLMRAGVDPEAAVPPTHHDSLQRRVSTTMSLHELSRYDLSRSSGSPINTFTHAASTPSSSSLSSSAVFNAPMSAPSVMQPPAVQSSRPVPVQRASTFAAAAASPSPAQSPVTAFGATSMAPPPPGPLAHKPQVRVTDNDPSPLLPRRKSVRTQKLPEIHNNVSEIRRRSVRGSAVLAERLPEDANADPKQSLPTPLKLFRWTGGPSS
jgi:serine/threonine protein kinase